MYRYISELQLSVYMSHQQHVGMQHHWLGWHDSHLHVHVYACMDGYTI